jgi:predicted component of type VI protein secretion system
MNKKIVFCLALVSMMLAIAGCSSSPKAAATPTAPSGPGAFSVVQTPVPGGVPNKPIATPDTK